jgi:pimeloyl-ACP methyl ester carboxylesterase
MAKRLFCFLLCALVAGCAHLVKISYPPGAVIHPSFDKPITTWEGTPAEVALTPSISGDSREYLANYDQVLVADSIRQRGLRHEYKQPGKGTPLVVFAKNPGITLEQKHYPQIGVALGITAVKEVRPGQIPILKLYNAFAPMVVQSAGALNQIAANFTAPLAVLDSHARTIAGSAAGSFLRPDDPRYATGIYLIQPYDPNKIPLLFIHGLVASPVSWQNLTNDLCSDPKVLEHYQPWFFLYATGQPVLESAAQLREELESTLRLFDPSGTAVASRHIVVVAHSMGGLLAHTLVSDSGDALWNVFASRPLNSLVLPVTDRNLLLKYFYFQHQRAVERIIFLAVPHRGSWLAAGIVGSIANRIIRHSKSPAEAMRDLEKEYPGTLDPYFAAVNRRGGPTGLFSLAPNPLLNRLAALPIKVPFHSIIGDRGVGDGVDGSDGIVSYRSAHLAGAESEKIVPAGHNLFSHPATVAEIKRILDVNLGEESRARR